MIPQRVRLRGFLCYKDEQEISFDGNATLWMLSGLNGSGKSSIFDAVTYSLFGHHRGGGQHAHELINKDCDGLTVEFDFLLDGHPYRAKRTLRRNTRGGAAGTQQIFRLESGNNGHASWVPLEGTGQKREFDAWVAENIGLTYETFTSSVLLLQGKAEKLLDSRPEGRREVLASIVDLERYERLHQKADERRRGHEAALKNLGNRLAALPPVSPEQLSEADARIASAEADREGARAEVERLLSLEHQARAWGELQGRLRGARQRRDEAEKLLVDASKIEKAVERLRELGEVLPWVHEIVSRRGEIHKAKVETERLSGLKGTLADDLTQLNVSLDQEQKKRELIKRHIDTDQARQQELTTRLVEVAVQFEKLKAYEQQESELALLREELARLPADPGADVLRAREEHDELVTLSQVVPPLARFRAKRDELRQALAAEEAAGQKQQAVRVRGEGLAAELKKLQPVVDEAAWRLQQAADEVTKLKTLLHQARESLKEITQLHGARAQVCRHCGQALTPGHLQEEKRRRSAEVDEVEARLKQATTAHADARAHDRNVREQFAQAEKVCQEARDEYRDAVHLMKQARADVERLREECGQVYGELPAPFRGRISPAPPSDWLATTYPTAEDLAAARSRASGLTGARRHLQQAEQVQQQWGNLKAKEAPILQHLKRLQTELPADRQSVRALHANLDNQEKALRESLSARRADLKKVEAEADRLGKKREEVRGQLAGLDAQLKEQELVQQHARQTIAKAQKALPPSWQPLAERAGLRELMEWKDEKTRLEEDRTEERGKELRQARLNLDVLKQDAADLEAKQGDFPEEARQDPAAIAARLSEAKRMDRARDEELSKARQQRGLLESYRRQREEVEQEYLATEKELAADRLLAELLGRERLQLYLVRQAERQVVEHANAVLDRLSGGQLYLKLSGEANGEGSQGKALELEAYNRSTGEKPINVAFLSGSQKFRVAVSLALGIGQYASRQHRPIESVIIDEGFGCLDSQGRQVMIQELQNLRGQMRCILLVSHQEEFAEAFSDGYHFQLEAGATRVKRFQK